MNSNAQNSVFYTDYLATKWPVSFIGHKVPCFFYWPQSALFLLLATKCLVSFIGHKVANAFALWLPHSLFWSQSGPCFWCWHTRIHCRITIWHDFYDITRYRHLFLSFYTSRNSAISSFSSSVITTFPEILQSAFFLVQSAPLAKRWTQFVPV